MKQLNLILCLIVGLIIACELNANQESAKKELDGKGIALSKYELYKNITAKNDEIVNLLYKAGVQPLKKNEELLFASYEGHYDTVKKLVDSGIDVNSSFEGQTPLIAASNKGNIKIIKFLLSKGANVDEGKSTSALLEAVKNNHLDCAKLLLEKGANPDLLKDDCVEPKDAITLAVNNKNNQMIKLLVECGSRLPYDDCELNFEIMLAPAITGNQDELNKYLFIIDESYPKISVKEYYECKALDLAIKYNNKKMVMFLLTEKKVKPTKQSIDIAKENNRKDILQLLEQYVDKPTLTHEQEHNKQK